MTKIAGVFQSNISKFNTYEVACEYASHCNAQGYNRGLFHGDDGLFWVVSGGHDISLLLKGGYEKIN